MQITIAPSEHAELNMEIQLNLILFICSVFACLRHSFKMEQNCIFQKRLKCIQIINQLTHFDMTTVKKKHECFCGQQIKKVN